MVKFYILFRSLCLIQVASRVSGCTSSCKSYQRIYDSVNDRLEYLAENKGENLGPQRNLDLAIKWLEGKATKGLFGENNYAAAKKQLESLKDLPFKCDSESFSIIKKNYQATGEWFNKLQQERIKRRDNMIIPSRPIDQIVYFYISQNAKNCLPKYQSDLRDKFNRIGFKFSQVKKLAIGWINGAFLRASGQERFMVWNTTTQDRLYDDIVEHLPEGVDLWQLIAPITGKPIGAIVFEAIEHLRENYDNVSKVSELYANDVVKPCKNYINGPEDSSLEAPHLDENLLLKIALKSKEDFLKLLDYNIGYVGRQLCKEILSNSRKAYKYMNWLLSERIQDNGRSLEEPKPTPRTTFSGFFTAAGVAAAVG